MSDEALVTAYALGELEGAEHATERARVEALAAREAGVRAEIERIRDVGDDLRREFFLENRMAVPALSADQRRAIERELAGAPMSAPAPARRLPPMADGGRGPGGGGDHRVGTAADRSPGRDGHSPDGPGGHGRSGGSVEAAPAGERAGLRRKRATRGEEQAGDPGCRHSG
jgi:hypothetical protein